jgi:hypothetical protein
MSSPAGGLLLPEILLMAAKKGGIGALWRSRWDVFPDLAHSGASASHLYFPLHEFITILSCQPAMPGRRRITHAAARTTGLICSHPSVQRDFILSSRPFRQPWNPNHPEVSYQQSIQQ